MASIKDLAPPWLKFYTAADWGIIWKRPPAAERLGDTETFIHHAAGNRRGTDPQAAMRDLQKWYHDVRDYSTIAYDIIVHRNVETEDVAILGAREGWLSAATKDRNDIGEAICLQGYFHPGHKLSEQPTEREIEALAFAVALSIENGWSSPDTKVLGHRQNPAHPGATSCPGDYLFPHVPHIGERAKAIIKQASNTPQELETPMNNPLGTINPQRAYDSRADSRGPLGPRETRTISVADKTHLEAFVNLTVISQDASPGYIAVNDANAQTRTGVGTSVVNYTDQDRLESNGVPVVVTDGNIKVTNVGGTAHVIVDVFAKK